MTDHMKLAQPGIRGLQPYQPGKPVEELERELGISDIIKLASNENPLGPSPAIAAALTAQFDELARYPDGSAYLLKARLADHLGVGADQLTIGNGSNDVLNLLSRVFLGPENSAVMSAHCFVVYPLAATAIGAEVRMVPAVDYGQDLAACLAAIDATTRLVFIANPNNPTGTWVDEATVSAFLDQVPADVMVVLDEAYFEYVQAPGYPDGIALLARYPNLVVTRTFSKAYGLAALRVGYAVSHPDVADLLNRLREPFNTNSLALASALAGLDDQAHIAKSVQVNSAGMSQLTAALDARGIEYIPSVGNFVTVAVADDAGPVYERLLHEGVIVRPIAGYGLPRHLRVTIGTATENDRFLQSLDRVLGVS